MSNSFVTPWSVAHQVPLSMGFPRPEYWSELPFPSPGDILDPRIKPQSPSSPTWPADSLLLCRLGSASHTWERVCVSAPLSVHPTLSFPCYVHTLFSTAASLFLPYKQVHRYHFLDSMLLLLLLSRFSRVQLCVTP